MTIKLSPIEIIKTQSRGLRGTLAQSLSNALTGQISEADQALIKFHGAYQQDDRDRRLEREQKKLERAYSFMIRLRIPGGDITAEQWQGLDRIAKSYGTGVIKITTRQTVQLHGILKTQMKPTIQDFYQLGLDSIAGCGDVNRNVMVGAHPSLTPFHAEVHEFAKKLSEHLLPTSRAFHEIWLDGEKLSSDEPEEDSLYQDRYLPRKFKIAIAIPPHNETDVFINDLGLIAIEENGQFIGFNVSVGGGLGTTHGNTLTYPRLGDVIGFIPKEKTLDVAWQVIAVQRDFGNREDRRFSRLKYTIDNMGIEKFKQLVEERLGFQFLPAKPFQFTQRGDFYSWQQDVDGLFYFTAFVESGRVVNHDNYALEQLLFDVTKQKLCGIRFTGNQNVMLTRIKPADREAVQILLEKHGVAAQSFSRVRRDALACVALNTCPLAMAEAQRYLPDFLIKVEELVDKHNLNDRDLMLRMTGCPNGCGRPYVAEIGLIGKALGQYNLQLGGDGLGTRLNRLYAESLNEEQILTQLDQWFSNYASQAQQNESFGDFVQRIGF
jgi:sulfite reductase (NADPH) hemoprotein beta-component